MQVLPVTPLRRSGSDFASAGGEDLAADKIRQLAMTEPGELPWRPSFGVGLEGLLHRSNDATTSQLARIRTREGIETWLAGDVELREINAEREDTTLNLSMRYEVKGRSYKTTVERS